MIERECIKEDIIEKYGYVLNAEEALNELQKEAYRISKDHGFHDDPEMEHPAIKLALIHSELSEVLEAYRKEGMFLRSEKIPEYTEVEEELADAVIRILDLAGSESLDLAGAILAKMDYNDSRPFRHGKRF